MPSLVFYERDELVRQRLIAQLADLRPKLTPIGQALDLEQLLQMCQTGRWEVAVVDLFALPENPLGFVYRLRRRCPTLPLVAICSVLERSRLESLISLGVLGLLASQDLADELSVAIRSALAGKSFLSRTISRIGQRPVVGDEP
jgi:DNA-binding NarL/FixJ family response regulator